MRLREATRQPQASKAAQGPAFGTIGFTTDIYAIGGLAFYLLTGRSPHDSSSLLDTVADEDLILSNEPVTPAEAKLVAVAKMALRKAIGSRPCSVKKLLAILGETADVADLRR